MNDCKHVMRMLCVVLLSGILLTSCDQPTNDTEKEPENTVKKYTVWTDSISYSEFFDTFGELTDGMYGRIELSNTEFASLSLSEDDEDCHKWTDEQIYNWFVGRGFGNSEATKEKAWLITTNHGFLASRTGSIVGTRKYLAQNDKMR